MTAQRNPDSEVDVLDIPQLGVRIEVQHSDEEAFTFDVVGRARGFLTASTCT
jgi:hypothetical protein